MIDNVTAEKVFAGADGSVYITSVDVDSTVYGSILSKYEGNQTFTSIERTGVKRLVIDAGGIMWRIHEMGFLFVKSSVIGDNAQWIKQSTNGIVDIGLIS